MRRFMIGLAPLALLASTSAGAANLMVFGGKDTRDVLLGDPAALIAGGTLTSVDTGLSQADLGRGHTVIGATISGTTASNIHAERFIYIKGGHVFGINLRPTADHTPKQISNVADACEINGVRSDFTVITNSWFLMRRAGADTACGTSDDFYSATAVGTKPGANPKSPGGLTHADAVYSASGAITGFVTVEGNKLKHRDGAFGTPTVLLDLANGDIDRHERVAQALYYAATPTGQTKPRLYRYDEASNTLSGALYAFTGAAGVDNGGTDASNFYFIDGLKVMRLPLTATSGGQAQVVTTMPTGLSPQWLVLDPAGSFVFFDAHNQFFGSGSGIYAVARNASNATATLLKATTAGTGGGVFPQLQFAAGDFAYISVLNFNTGAMSALRISGDGLTKTNTADSYWSGAVVGSSFDFSMSSEPSTPVWVIRASRVMTSDTLRLVSPADGSNGPVLGTVDNVDVSSGPAVFAFALGRYGAGSAQIARTVDTADSDAFVFDSNRTGARGSLTMVLQSVGVDDQPLAGD